MGFLCGVVGKLRREGAICTICGGQILSETIQRVAELFKLESKTVVLSGKVGVLTLEMIDLRL